jgi:hypothetical protein
VNKFYAATGVKLTDARTYSTEIKNCEFSGFTVSLKKSIFPPFLTQYRDTISVSNFCRVPGFTVLPTASRLAIKLFEVHGQHKRLHWAVYEVKTVSTLPVRKIVFPKMQLIVPA